MQNTTVPFMCEMGLRSNLAEMVPFAAMIMVECLDVGLSTVSKAAMSKGMSHFVFVVYSNALATLLLSPGLIFNRSERPHLTFSLIWKFFLLSLIGITVMQNCVFTGINYSSPTLASALSNLVPAFTFLLAVIFRMEKLDLRKSRSQIKVIGTLVLISGALVVTSYKGPAIGSVPKHSDSNTLTTADNWILGGIFISIACLSYAISNIFQADIMKRCPSEVTVVAFYCLFGTFQCTILTLIAEGKNMSAWILSTDIELISVIYSALFGSLVTYYVQAWCIHTKGPVFVAMFKPMRVGIAALFSVIFLGETLHIGSIIGALIIVTGFYGVIWAESGDDKEGGSHDSLPPSSHTTPLLPNLHTV